MGDDNDSQHLHHFASPLVSVSAMDGVLKCDLHFPAVKIDASCLVDAVNDVSWSATTRGRFAYGGTNSGAPARLYISRQD
jgi:hypothetical protein